MRLTDQEKETIIKLTKKYYGNNAKVYLFGSRVYDNKRGGDIDLLIEIENNAEYANKIKFLAEYERLVNSRKVDLIISSFAKNGAVSSANPIFASARIEGIELC
ncbi:MAG: nucleotidyltransferase domain-containing protein [Candidatus Acididesulfobacter diazotrophicus]|jgi:predicted nucleotidyltransferase|uniref:Nucleotidyltransferase domain-containing protein n=1 Tax=Candidatus Acididesulfobacter diazotrophicus TaxID=2597226 RepID=A0A519BJR1_9DELT|nr:MAG: nucleotidyltransferase domain-containing protein [Candidatus Acididesulfobacter diazotrophicus]